MSQILQVLEGYSIIFEMLDVEKKLLWIAYVEAKKKKKKKIFEKVHKISRNQTQIDVIETYSKSQLSILWTIVIQGLIWCSYV